MRIATDSGASRPTRILFRTSVSAPAQERKAKPTPKKPERELTPDGFEEVSLW